jgi:hypothetical protein
LLAILELRVSFDLLERFVSYRRTCTQLGTVLVETMCGDEWKPVAVDILGNIYAMRSGILGAGLAARESEYVAPTCDTPLTAARVAAPTSFDNTSYAVAMQLST